MPLLVFAFAITRMISGKFRIGGLHVTRLVVIQNGCLERASGHAPVTIALSLVSVLIGFEDEN